MNWCQKHWDELRAEVQRQGLSGFISSSGERMAENLAREIDGEATVDTFDPLMGAMWAMNSFIGETLGPGGHLTVMMHDGCPICKVDEVHVALCKDDPCTYGSVAKFFVNAVADQKAELGRRQA